jgi:hypothetical protein
MLFLRACMLWALVSGNIVGAAFLFRRWFPKESPWLGFVVPEVMFILLCTFVEHQVALTGLWLLFFVSSLASVWVIVKSRDLWRVMRLPSVIFISLFAFTLLLRYLRPSIPHVRDGIPDLSLVSAFLMGQTLPVDSTWIPPVKLEHYYFLDHYAASLVIRVFSLDVGTGFNICAALLSTYIYFFIAGAAWLIGRGRMRVVLLTLFLTICAGTGATGYMWLTVTKDLDPEDVSNLYTRLEDPDVHLLLWKFLTPIGDYDRHELMVPGFWSWMGCFHSASAGQMLICFCLFSLIEMVRCKSTIWPWICMAVNPLLMLTCCSWGLPLSGLFFLAGLLSCWRRGIAPGDWRVVVLVAVAAGVCLAPMLNYFLMWASPGIDWNSQFHTQVAEFIVLWWPLYLPWLVLFFAWKRLGPAVHISMLLTPIGFTLVELFNVGQRYDMTGKLWGMIFGAGWIVFVPALIIQRGWIYRVVLAALIAGSTLSLFFWLNQEWSRTNPIDIGHLDGYGPLRWDDRKAKILEAVSQLKHQTIIAGKSSWAYCECPALGHFTLNPVYVTYSTIADCGFYTNGLGEGWKREVPVNNLYDGKCANPLLYLRQRDIAALVIYPDDNVSDENVEKLKKALEPYYSYEDYRDGDPLTPPNAGIFIYHPGLTDFPAAALTPAIPYP